VKVRILTEAEAEMIAGKPMLDAIRKLSPTGELDIYFDDSGLNITPKGAKEEAAAMEVVAVDHKTGTITFR
jgi:hypothetical protein